MYVDPRYLLSGRGRVGGEPTANHMTTAMPTAITLRMINPIIDTVYGEARGREMVSMSCRHDRSLGA
jgi:hypothetical protein